MNDLQTISRDVLYFERNKFPMTFIMVFFKAKKAAGLLINQFLNGFDVFHLLFHVKQIATRESGEIFCLAKFMS